MKKAYARDDVRELIEARRKAEHIDATRMEAAELRGELKSARRLIEHGMSREQVAEILGLQLEDLL